MAALNSIPKLEVKDRVGANENSSKSLRAYFKLAKHAPKEFVDLLTWTISDSVDAIFADKNIDGRNNCFQSRTWMESWEQEIANAHGSEFKLVTGSIAGISVLMLPLAILSNRFAKRLQYAAQDVSDYNFPIFHPEISESAKNDLLDEVILHLTVLFPNVDCIDFRKCLLTEPMTSGSQLGWRTEADQSHLCRFEGNWNLNRSRFVGKSSSKSLKRKLKKLESMGELTFDEPNSDIQKNFAIETLCLWKAAQLNHLGSASVFQDEKFRNFLTAVVTKDESETVRMFEMNIDQRPVALILMLCAGERWFLYQTAFTSDEASKFSPGYLLLLHVMEQACEEGAEIFDFGWGNEEYKLRFATEHLTLHHVFLPLTVKGKITQIGKILLETGRKTAKSNAHVRSLVTLALRMFEKVQRR